MLHRTAFFALLLVIGIAACAAPTAPPMSMGGSAPAGLDFSTTRTGDNGRFRATYTSELTPIVINALHAWTLHVETVEGAPVEEAVIGVSGGMPEHNHGMPTQPQVTEKLGGGDYRVEGVQFQMGGWWTVTFVIDAGGTQDTVTFNLQLK
jgi:hypothetical protein